MKWFLLVGLFMLSSCITFDRPIVAAKTRDEQQALTPWQALERLKEGNRRFLSSDFHERDLKAQLRSSKKQYPFALILGCMDSRGAPELIFDKGIGDIFAERLAGNVVNDDVLGGMEFATKLVGVKLIVVMGHTSCGAIKGACQQAKLEHLTGLLQKIEPAIEKVKKSEQNFTCESDAVLDKISAQHVTDVVHLIVTKSATIKKLIEEKQIGIVGAMQDLATGGVTFLEERALLPGAPR